MIVIDVGCARYGGDYSIERLIEEFSPELLFGFDPSPALDALGPGEPFWIGKTEVLLERMAAWTFDGEIGYVEDGLGSTVTERTEEKRVKCFDLARFIRELPPAGPVKLKIDAEGAEYDLLGHLMMEGADELLTLAWVEWHGSSNRDENGRRLRQRELIERDIACEIAEWRW